MSQTNDIHPQLGTPPSPMTEEGTTGVPARAEAIDDQVGAAGGDTPVHDGLAADRTAEDGSVDFGATADDATDDDEPDELGGFVVTDEDDGATEQVATEEFSVTDDLDEGDPTPPDVPVVLQDDGTGVEDADVETSADDAPPVAGGLSQDDTDFSIGHVFDQTNGVIDGLEGESDGTVAGEEESAADRGGLNQPNPVGRQDAFADDHYGEDDGRDPNP